MHLEETTDKLFDTYSNSEYGNTLLMFHLLALLFPTPSSPASLDSFFPVGRYEEKGIRKGKRERKKGR